MNNSFNKRNDHPDARLQSIVDKMAQKSGRDFAYYKGNFNGIDIWAAQIYEPFIVGMGEFYGYKDGTFKIMNVEQVYIIMASESQHIRRHY